MADLQYAQVGIPFTSPGYEIKTQEQLEAHVRSVEKARIAMWQSLAGTAMSGTRSQELEINAPRTVSTAVVKVRQAASKQSVGISY